jgi:hypothetical protein
MGNFRIDGHYTVSNNGGYEIMISDCGSQAKVRDSLGSDNIVTDWLDIDYAETDDEVEPIIDINGYNIPLNMVTRV